MCNGQPAEPGAQTANLSYPQSAISVGRAARWLMPSIGSLCLLLVLYLLITGSWRFLLDSDTGWHIRTGDLIWQTRAVPRHDPFSFTMPGEEWFAWEWLACVMMSAAHRAYGLAGVVGGAILLLYASYAALHRLMLWRSSDVLIACVLTLFAALASVVHWLARPHLFSIALMVVWYALVESYRRRRSRWIYAVPLLLLLWANLHAAFIVTLPLLAIYAAGEALELASRRERESHRWQQVLLTYTLVGLLSAIAGLATPYGWRLYGHLWRYLSDKELLAIINEFQSPDFHKLDGKLIELLLLLGAIAAARAFRQRRFVEVGLLLFWAHLTLQAERHVTLAVIVMVPIIAEQCSAMLGEAASRISGGDTLWARRWRALRTWYCGILAIDRQITGAFLHLTVPIFLLVVTGSRWAEKLLHPHFDAQRMPVAAADFIAAAKLSGNLYAHDQYGGYLIYRLYPQIKVFIDGRSDFYRRGQVLEDAIKIATLQPSWAEALARYDVRCMLLRRDEPLALLAQMSGQWVSIYHDSTAQVLVKKTP